MQNQPNGRAKNTFIESFEKLPSFKKAGFFLWPSLGGEELSNEEKDTLEGVNPSGVVLFRRNLKSMGKSRLLIKNLKSCARMLSLPRPLVVAVDEEGGRVSRLPPPFPRGQPAFFWGESGDLQGLRDQLLHQAFVARGLGINCFLAPVADVLYENTNPALGDRAFHTNPQVVAKYALFVHQVLSEEGILTCGKHFPGLGKAGEDTHTSFAESLATLEDLECHDWLPFRTLIQGGIPALMTSHLLLPHLDPIQPATLSSKILTSFLKGHLGFSGLILSDDLRMNAIALHYGTQKAPEASATGDAQASIHAHSYLGCAAIQALKAGCDILLSCQSICQEMIIIESLIQAWSVDPDFYSLLVEKAWKIYEQLGQKSLGIPESKHFDLQENF